MGEEEKNIDVHGIAHAHTSPHVWMLLLLLQATFPEMMKKATPFDDCRLLAVANVAWIYA